MAQPAEPMIKLEPGGTAPILSYNVPEPTSYSGRHILELNLPPEDFTEAALEVPPPPVPSPVPPPVIVRPGADVIVGGAEVLGMQPMLARRTVVAKGAPPVLKSDDVQEAIAKTTLGYRVATYRDFAGRKAVKLLPPLPPEPEPRLLLIEVYRLSSYLGAYGAGRVLKTFTLLPGEKTKISVKSYTRRTTDEKAASSILDSYTEESADEFEDSLSSEQSDKQSQSRNTEYSLEASASASWGFGSAKVSAGFKHGTASAREEFSKNVSNATQKHSAKASAKRDVQINTSYEVKEETGEETATERAIENVNLSRVLNFVFRQMNQQFVTILQLVDVRVAFFNNYPEIAQEVALPQIDTLLEKFIVPARRQEVRDMILNQVDVIRDYDGNEHTFIESTSVGPDDDYIRVKRDLQFSYTEPITGQEIAFTGIPLAVNTYTMRTEGVIVEALLGQASALDQYAEELQQLEVKRRTAEVARIAAEADRAVLINSLAQSKDVDAARVLAELTCPCGGTAAKPAAS